MTSRFYRQFPKSTVLKSVSFRANPGPKGVGVLRVKFRNGATYQYSHAHTKTVAEFLLTASEIPSAGMAYHRIIRGLRSERLAPRSWKR
jgi:hypothetical protein